MFFVISWIIIHFGINPDSGGSPPIDKRVTRIRTAITGILFHVWESDRVVVVELAINSVNIVEVMIMYIIKFNSVIVGLYGKTAVIQPMWAIDE